jgi:enoyl-[acyl-carrier-protein] reductase (NADH)
MQALQRIGELADIGSVVAFLASDDACWITGDTIRVDGGSKLWAFFLTQRPTAEYHGWTGGSYSVRPF